MMMRRPECLLRAGLNPLRSMRWARDQGKVGVHVVVGHLQYAEAMSAGCPCSRAGRVQEAGHWASCCAKS